MEWLKKRVEVEWEEKEVKVTSEIKGKWKDGLKEKNGKTHSQG